MYALLFSQGAAEFRYTGAMQSESIPQVGHVAPDFTLPDSSGHPRRLSELTEKGPLVLIFFRGHW